MEKKITHTHTLKKAKLEYELISMQDDICVPHFGVNTQSFM